MTTADRGVGRLSFREEGAGVPVVLLHGTCNSGAQWCDLSRHLASRYRVLAPDLAGYGASQAVLPRHDGALAGHADMVRALITACGEPAHVVGHSFGGAVALKVALDMPDAVRSLTLIEPAAFHLLRGGGRQDRCLYAIIRAVADVIAASAAADRPEEGVARFVDFWNGEGAWAAARSESRAAAVSQVARITDDFAALFGEASTVEACRKVHKPTLCLTGMSSPAVTRRISRLVADAIPGAQFHVVLGAGHMLPVTHPRIVDPIVAGHLIAADARAGHRPRRSVGEAA